MERDVHHELGSVFGDELKFADLWEFHWSCNGQGRIVPPEGPGWILVEHIFPVTATPDAFSLHLLWKRPRAAPGLNH